MTQQPYYPPQQPGQGYPPQPAPQQYPPQYPQAPQPQFPQQPQQQQQGFPPQYGQPYPPQQPQAPQIPLAQGGLDEFYSQPSTGGGKGISWTDPQGNQRPVGTTFIGVVARDVTNGDVSQVTNKENVPQNFRDGRPKWQLKVPLKQVALFDPQGMQLPLPPEFTDGEATWYVKGQGREELTRAMAEARTTAPAPEGGAIIRITLVQRRPNGGGMNPSNIVQVSYTLPEGQAPAAASPQPAPPAVQQAAPQQPAEQPQAPAQPQYQQPVPQQVQQQVPAPQQPQYQQPAYAGPQAAQAPVQQQVPGQLPQGMSQEQAELYARITGQGQPAA